MHFVISWDIKAQGEEWNQLNNKLLEQLKGYSWVRPLYTFYVVEIPNKEQWASLLKAMQPIAQQSAGKINFIMSPVMQGGRYDGSLPKTTWDEVNKRTT